ncbi:protein-glutamate O-methyltransferase CheR [Cytophagaceae bacterium ABcell3]|nr:protein-glutamate O-methyltransferase CheR [Cytophagaceae bacterium ABcell3]
MTEISENKLEELLSAISKKYGYDFINYSRASIIRRVSRFMEIKNIDTVIDLKDRIVSDEQFFASFIEELTVNVTEMFRDPAFYKSLRENVVPQLHTYPFLKIWNAGCSSGEEVYSLAIILEEEELYHKSKIYATDINQKVLAQAREGIYHISLLKDYTANYIRSGGRKSFSEYYTVKYNHAMFDSRLRKNVTFSVHNLVNDSSFNEFNLIMCRNVLIYFNKELQEQVIELFLNSLCMFGYLVLGNKETLTLSKFRDRFEVIDKEERIYRRIR